MLLNLCFLDAAFKVEGSGRAMHGFFVCRKPTFVDGTLEVVGGLPIWNIEPFLWRFSSYCEFERA
jgi:hypothetical protein